MPLADLNQTDAKMTGNVYFLGSKRLFPGFSQVNPVGIHPISESLAACSRKWGASFLDLNSYRFNITGEVSPSVPYPNYINPAIV